VTEDDVKKAFEICDAAFHLYIQEATKTHEMLSKLSGAVSLDQRIEVNGQRIRENETQIAYMETRQVLFEFVTLGRLPAHPKTEDIR